MSGETNDDVSAFTVDSLHAHLRGIIDERDRRYEQRFEASQTAVDRATASLERRLEGMNEFRATLSDQAARLLPRTEYDTAHQALEDRVAELKDRLNRGDGQRSGIRMSAGVIVGTLGALASLVAVIGFLFYLAAR